MRSPLLVLALFSLMMFVSACERESILDPGPDTAPPLPPTGLLLDGARDGYVLFSWLKSREADFSYYIVYRSEERDAGTFVAVDSVSQNFFYDEQRSYDTLYTYYVTAVDRSGNESLPSEKLSTRSPNRFAPEAPRFLLVDGENSALVQRVRLSWEKVDEADIREYHVYRSEQPIGAPDSTLLVHVTQRNWYDDEGANTVGARYHYLLTTVDRGGFESSPGTAGNDVLSERPLIVAPAENGSAPSFPLFRWLSVPQVLEYHIELYQDVNGGVVWTTTVDATAIDTVSYRYDGIGLAPGSQLYWQVYTVTQSGGKPNGISGKRRMFIDN